MIDISLPSLITTMNLHLLWVMQHPHLPGANSNINFNRRIPDLSIRMQLDPDFHPEMDHIFPTREKRLDILWEILTVWTMIVQCTVNLLNHPCQRIKRHSNRRWPVNFFKSINSYRYFDYNHAEEQIISFVDCRSIHFWKNRLDHNGPHKSSSFFAVSLVSSMPCQYCSSHWPCVGAGSGKSYVAELIKVRGPSRRNDALQNLSFSLERRRTSIQRTE